MLPAHIIHDILNRQRDREKDKLPELFIDLPRNSDDGGIPAQKEEKENEDRGFAIIDFVI